MTDEVTTISPSVVSKEVAITATNKKSKAGKTGPPFQYHPNVQRFVRAVEGLQEGYTPMPPDLRWMATTLGVPLGPNSPSGVRQELYRRTNEAGLNPYGCGYALQAAELYREVLLAATSN